MKHLYLIKKLWGVCFVFISILILTNSAYGQLIYQPYSYQFYQKLNTVEYSPDSRLHTSIKPYFISDSSVIRHTYDSLMMSNVDNTGKSWLHRVFFSGHVIDVKNKSYTFSFDYLPDVQIGRELESKQTISLNTRGFQLSGTIGTKFFFYSSGYESQGRLPNYETNYINQTLVIPSEIPVNTRPYDLGSIDWTYVTSLIGYVPNKSVTISLGQDKLFIGDGYRSILLSDNAPAYPLLRVTVDITKNIQYTATWAYLEDQNAPQFDSFGNNRRKWAAFHYIDWNISNRASLGFFNAIVSEETNDQGISHGFDVNYVDPVFFSSSLGPSDVVQDHTLFGFSGKYKVLNKTTIYGQLLFDQDLSVDNGSNISAWQLGFKGSDMFTVNSLNYLFEFNTAQPYTYSNSNPIVSYTQLSEPLADPLGANFKELIGIINYSIGRFDFQFEGQYAQLGLDIGSINYGNDIIVPNNESVPSQSITTGQGLATTIKFAQGTIAYVLNPKYNFRIEIGGLLRQEKNSLSDTKTEMFTIGLRSSFRDLYSDF